MHSRNISNASLRVLTPIKTADVMMMPVVELKSKTLELLPGVRGSHDTLGFSCWDRFISVRNGDELSFCLIYIIILLL